MTLNWETILPLIISAGLALIVWVVKIAATAIGSSLTRKLQEKIDKLEAEKTALEKRIDYNNERIDFLIETLIKRNS